MSEILYSDLNLNIPYDSEKKLQTDKNETDKNLYMYLDDFGLNKLAKFFVGQFYCTVSFFANP